MLNLTDMKKRRRYDREYKQMVIELANTREDISVLAAELDLRPDLIYRWRREALANDGASFPGQGNKTMTDEQKELYLKERNTIRNLILQDERLTNFTLLSSISKLRQLANHPQMIFKDYEYHSGKMEQIINDFETLRSEGHKVLIFSSFVKHLEIARSIFEEKGWKYSILTGQTRNRAVAIDYFNDNADVYAFFISLKAGGTGLNLTQADYVFLLDPWWNPASEQQALSRAYRIGQDKNVFVYRYITKDSIEEKIQQLQQRKSSLSKEFINTNNPLTSLTDEEWKELLT